MTVVSYDNNTGVIVARTRELTAADIGIYRIGCFTTDEGISTINSPKTTRIVLFGAADVRAVIPQQINVQEETKVRTVHLKVKGQSSRSNIPLFDGQIPWNFKN